MSQLCLADPPATTPPERAPRWRADATDARATRLMARFRKTGSPAVFEELFKLTSAQLMRRVRQQVRFAGDHLDPHELLQDTFVNIFRYPDRFDPHRPGAFRAWATTIVDNTVRRHLRRARSGPDIALRTNDVLALEPDLHAPSPERHAIDDEACRSLAGAYGVILISYLLAYQQLTDRERCVLHAVEVAGLRYAELGERLGLRPEAVKMVVFRARRRILERVARQLQIAA